MPTRYIPSIDILTPSAYGFGMVGETLVRVIVGATATGLVSLFSAIAIWFWNLKKTIDSIYVINNMRSEQMTELFNLQFTQTRAIRTVLEVTARGENNGNVDRAMNELNKSESSLYQMLVSNKDHRQRRGDKSKGGRDDG